MFGELQIVPCGHEQGCRRREGWQGGLSQILDFIALSATQMFSGLLPTWVLTLAGIWGSRKGMLGECMGKSGKCCMGHLRQPCMMGLGASS